MKSKRYASSTVHSIRVTLAKVLQIAVEQGYLERNPAHGIQIGEREPKKARVYLEPLQVQRLLAGLPEPCRAASTAFGMLTSGRACP